MNKGIAPIAIVLIIIGVLALGGGAWYYQQQREMEKLQKQAEELAQPTQSPSTTSKILKSDFEKCKEEKSTNFNELSKNPNFNPVYTYGKVEFPRKVDYSKFKINYGMFDVSDIHPDGIFCLIMNKNQKGGILINVMSETDILLQYITINPFEGQNISIDTKTTAISLIYMQPGVPSGDSKNAKIIIDYIKGLKETSDLADVLKNELSKENIYLSSLSDNIKNDISKALSALIQKVKNCGGLIENCQR